MERLQTDRRLILGMGAAFGAAALPSLAAAAESAAAPAAPWQPALEPQDAWMDRPGTRHRMVYDTTSPGAAEGALGYAENFYLGNKTGYGLDPSAIGIIIVLRHMSTPFGFNDVIWTKYGALLAEMLKLQGEQAIRAARQNPLLTPAPRSNSQPVKAKGADDEPVTMTSLNRKGTRFAVCGMASEGMATLIAKKAGGDAKAVLKEMTANLVPGGVIVPAGIVAVNRAQERGYAFVNIAE